MLDNDSVSKKKSVDGELTVYLSSRDFSSHLDPIDGGITLEKHAIQQLGNRQVHGQLIAHFRFGRESDETMSLKFYKDFILDSKQIYPPVVFETDIQLTTKQFLIKEKLKNKSMEMYPFNFHFPKAAPTSICLFSKKDYDFKKSCGIQYYIMFFVGHNEDDRSHRKYYVKLNVRRIENCNLIPTHHLNGVPCATVQDTFLICSGAVELEASLDQKVFAPNERIAVNIGVQNHSNKIVRKIIVKLIQQISIRMVQNHSYKRVIFSTSHDKYCPIAPGCNTQMVVFLDTDTLSTHKLTDGVALDGNPKIQDANIASTSLTSLTMRNNKIDHDYFGIHIQYFVQVKLDIGLMHAPTKVELPIIILSNIQ